MRQLVHSLSCDNNLLSYHLWSRQIVRESEKVYKCFVQDCTLGIRMCSTELLLWKNQKSLTPYPMILYKLDSTAEIFLGIFNFFRTTYFTKQLQTNNCKGLLFAWNVK